MKKSFILICIVMFNVAFTGCESCECDCSGEVNILNSTDITYSFEIQKGSTVIFEGTIMGIDDVLFGLEEGKFKFAYGEQTLNLEKSFNIIDCETTTLVLGN